MTPPPSPFAPPPLDARALGAAIRNAAFMVRHYCRPIERLKRAQAIQLLGLAVRHAFNSTEDFAPLLLAFYEGLRPHDEPPF